MTSYPLVIYPEVTVVMSAMSQRLCIQLAVANIVNLALHKV